ncbi:MAG TPA: carboxymuconolactone decarboxylase family protein [Solirubrobacteraceae bacterium]|nr:carboxymuconolactone decarboxylase family protein [Solirubrobacteraceae bacterium]
MENAEELLRRLALNDESAVQSVLAGSPEAGGVPALEAKIRALVSLSALLAMGASTTSLRWMAETAYEAGATDEEIVGVLVAAGPELGVAGIVCGAPRLALAIGYDVEDVIS